MSLGVVPRAGRSPWAVARDFILPLGIIASVLVILVPLPTAIMDVLLAANISVSVVVLLTTIYVRTPLEFSVFPSLLLAATLGRLVLNIATTRLILTQAQTRGMLAAGEVVKSFGEFVAGDKLVVGLVIFSIIVVIQFVVITKGATRISEVAARFALDGMPGRQMAVDADLNAGIIDQKEAQRRRAEIVQQADFFGAMDGASKFVRGDAIAGIIITLVNIIGGFVIGVADAGMPISQAASLFTRLTIGDGLVTQIPAFLISLAAALLMTRSTGQVNLPVQFVTQLFSRPQALVVTGGFLGLLVFTSLPALPLLTIGGGCLGLAATLTRRQREADAQAEAKAQTQAKRPAEERVEDFLAVDPMEVEIGVGLIRLADPKRGGDLLDRIQRIRQNVAAELGIIMPKVRIRDNMRLETNQYRIKIADIPIAAGSLQPGRLLAVDSGATTGKVNGLQTREPAFDTPAAWIEPQAREQAAANGWRVVDPVSVLATHLTEVVRRHADEILNRDATKHLVEELRKSSPAVVDELIPNQMKLAEVQQILQMLLREQVSIRQLGPILEALGEYAPRIKDPAVLTEYARHRLARAICSRYRDKENRLFVVTLDPALEDRIGRGLEHTAEGLSVRISPRVVDEICRRIEAEVENLVLRNRAPIVLVGPQIRSGLKHLTVGQLPRLVVLSYNEITRDARLESIAMVPDVESEQRVASPATLAA